jgi:hypothetical protein
MADNHGKQASGEDLDLIRFSSEAVPDPKREKRIPLFYIDEKVYTVPQFPAPTIGLKYLKLAHEEGSDEANYWLLSSMLGEEGYEALMEYSDKGLLSDEDYDAVVAKALRIVSRQEGSPKGKNRQNGGRSRRG